VEPTLKTGVKSLANPYMFARMATTSWFFAVVKRDGRSAPFFDKPHEVALQRDRHVDAGVEAIHRDRPGRHLGRLGIERHVEDGSKGQPGDGEDVDDVVHPRSGGTSDL
jgi:hypothetical protein